MAASLYARTTALAIRLTATASRRSPRRHSRACARHAGFGVDQSRGVRRGAIAEEARGHGVAHTLETAGGRPNGPVPPPPHPGRLPPPHQARPPLPPPTP